MGVIGMGSCHAHAPVTEHKTYLEAGWQLFSSASTDADGEEISNSHFDKSFGYPIEVPATAMHGLMQNDMFPDIFEPYVLENMDKTPYEVPWWYRKEIEIKSLSDKDFYQLTFEGINFKANIWLNGTRIAREDSVQGSYGVWNFDITPYLKMGRNILAVEIIPPVFGKDVHKGFVDWNPTPADRLMGIWRGVLLSHTGPVSMRHANVVSKVDKETLKSAELTLSTELTNHSHEVQRALVTAAFDDVVIQQQVELQPNEHREIFFRPNEYPELQLDAARLWWPNNMGEQYLYDLTLNVEVDARPSDEESFRFGIREVEDFWNESGYRGFMVNGQKVMIRSAGWVDNIFLADPDEKVEAQMKYAQHMNLNSIRLESFWGRNRTIMNKADEYGLLLMLGWTAHWEWDSYLGFPHDDYVSIRGTEAKTLHANNYRDQVLWHRRHPSVAIWTYGSDKLPRPSLEIMLNERMAKADTTRPILSYCGGTMLMGASDPRQSEISGPTGVKMEGPYDWVPPVYWYIDKRYGGAFGFNTEVGPGPQIPPLSTIKKMLPEDHLWPIDSIWLYYSGRNQFENLDRFLNAFNTRYGESQDLETFLLKNQMSSYEAIRPMFEAFAVNKFHSTGVVQWMFNSAWPTFYWQLFDYYLMPNGAFYGTKKAAAPLVPIYNYGDKSIYINNDHLNAYHGLVLQTRVYDIHSNLLFSNDQSVDIDANSAQEILKLPELDHLSTSYFLNLRLKNGNGDVIENNFYWLSTVADIPDFDQTTWYWTPNKQHADFTALNDLSKARVEFNYSVQDDLMFSIEVHNPTEKIAFFIELTLADKDTKEPITPVFWDDNYISLLPGERRTINGHAEAKNIDASSLEIVVQGSNLE
ncbi:beta-mannosidase [Geofilum rubicundum JCM 15548]|uniref:Beta-mannosidase n=1 Tax=Geofilum rubicundum JCM 15548 TaxID=1236989 RepID=A0A0E9LWZ0_9BACT|nr:beta-mannosidase [Geofilum rubicundum JCM 15548]